MRAHTPPPWQHWHQQMLVDRHHMDGFIVAETWCGGSEIIGMKDGRQDSMHNWDILLGIVEIVGRSGIGVVSNHVDVWNSFNFMAVTSLRCLCALTKWYLFDRRKVSKD